jgi:phospholipid/cholesterol/gamma-HCH transport system permease protein
VTERIAEMGRMGVFLARAILLAFVPPFRFRRIVEHIHFIGVRSLLLTMVTSLFTGMVLALQGYRSLRSYGAVALLGSSVAITLVRGAAPILAAIMVASRAGSALTAEIGAMRISEQIDALEIMALSPIQYLATPAILAGIIAMPLLMSVYAVVGTFGGYIVAIHILGVDAGAYIDSMRTSLDWSDIQEGISKSLAFGILVTWICTYKGFSAGHGARGVSRATTEGVVLSIVLVLVFDYFFTAVGVFR